MRKVLMGLTLVIFQHDVRAESSLLRKISKQVGIQLKVQTGTGCTENGVFTNFDPLGYLILNLINVTSGNLV
jgi:hypothetical protein